MRLFVALNLPDAEKTRLGAVLDELRQTDLPFRWLETDSLHLTLKFLGEVAESRVTEIGDTLDRATSGIGPFDMEIAGFGAFPERTRPRIVWIGANAPAALGKLQQKVEAELEPLGFEREKRAFHPHLTLGRARNDSGRVDARALDRITSSLVYKAKVRVDSVDLMRSHLGSRGARYERIQRHGLPD